MMTYEIFASNLYVYVHDAWLDRGLILYLSIHCEKIRSLKPDNFYESISTTLEMNAKS